MPGGNSKWEPPESISNSEVKTLSANGSVGSPHVRVGHCQALNMKPPANLVGGFLFLASLRDSPICVFKYTRIWSFFHGEPPLSICGVSPMFEAAPDDHLVP